MSDDPRLLSVDEYRARVLAAVSPAAPARTVLRDCLGLVLTEDVTSQISLPSFDNSSMDGYAVRAADVGSAGADSAVRLSVAGESAAGGVVPDEVRPGTATKIMTGAAMPPGADAVVPYE